MGKQKFPVTPAVRLLRSRNIAFSHHLYTYETDGGSEVCARELGIDHHQVVKTLVFAADGGDPLLMLMHGDCEVSSKNLARTLAVKSVCPVSPEQAFKLTGYQVGGISPFATRQSLPVYLEQTVLEMETVYINGGKRGFILGMRPGDICAVLNPSLVLVSQSA